MKTQNKLFKNILGGLFLASMMGVTTACDPLGIEPTTKVDEERFWQNDQLARAYVNNFYFIGETGSGQTFQSEQWSDNCQGNYEQDWSTYRQETFNKRRYDEESAYTGPWSSAYRNIRDIYVGIEKISSSSAVSEQLKNQLLAECHFFLAYVYFDMIKFWGSVPYVDKALNITDETYLPRTPRETIFDNILANLDTSVQYFNAAGVAHTTGMVNEDVANAFKSRVALYAANAAEASGFHTDDAEGLFKFTKAADHYYNLAYNAANAVTGYALEENYEDLFTSPEAHTSVESIWPVMFKDGQRSGFNPTAINGPDHYYYGATEDFSPIWERRSGLFPTQDLVDCYLMKDEATGKWMNWWETSQMVALGVTKNADGEITGETAEYRKMFENRDKRFYATVTYDGSYMGPEDEMYLIQTWVDDTDPVNTLKYSALHAGMRFMDNINSVPVNRSSAQTVTGYYSRKYSQFNSYNTDGTLNTTQRTTCYFNLRYAEVMLNKAEAAYKLGKTDYQSLVNQIRNRAGLDNYSGSDWWSEIKTQRRLEFAFECPGHRYFDLLRWSEAEHKSVIDELNTPSRGLWISRKGIESTEVELNGYPVEPGGEGYFTPKFHTFNMSDITSNYDRKFDHSRYYFTPFSVTTLRDYKQLQQNPGWSGYNYNN
ncbi:MAG: RagB/SusD family nutrient uptake outer membrane protein [Bacteroidaceae bacterium]|nr:RagB/SusD family nutrient uptake outer membrane protein [Bacteroidaceae bacterium]